MAERVSEEDSRNDRAEKQHEVVIIGGGFGGLNAALSLRRAPVRVTLLDRRNHHLFQPLLYQVATGGLSPANIAAPLRAILKRQKRVRVLLAEAAWGLLFGVVHWAVVGMGLGILPLMHPRIRDGEIEAPGFYALRFLPMTAMGFLMLHLVFGVIVGAFYGAWAG